MLRVGHVLWLLGLRAAGRLCLLLLLLHLWSGHAVCCEEGDEFLFWEGKAQGAEGDAELVVVEVAVAVQVEEGELLLGLC